MTPALAPAQRRAGRRLMGLTLALGLMAAGLDTGRARFDAWLGATPLPPLSVVTGTEVVARDGSLLRAFQVEDGIWRLAPPPGGVDPAFIDMLLVWEDRRFRSHAGVDTRAVLRAVAQSLRRGRIVSGASTLSMQTARLLERGPTGDWRGKLRQARLALAMERRLTKDQILALYLRLAPYGGNVEGVRAASLMWFGKEPRRLTPAEAALLVALPQSPEARRPDRPAGRAAARIARDRVLARARAAGLIDAETEAAARATPLPDRRRPFPAHAPLLAQRLAAESPGAARIETTIDPALQRAAEAIIARAVQAQTAQVSAAALLADHRTGEVLASVGTGQWSDQPSAGFVDMTLAVRSPGSTLKPFVYALGFDDGLIHPETLIEDRPASFGLWQPVNFDRRFRGTVTVRRAMSESLNIPVVRVAASLGPARVAALLRQAGMEVGYAGGVPGLAVVLGGAGVSLHDLVQGYAALGNRGVAVALRERPGGGPDVGGRTMPGTVPEITPGSAARAARGADPGADPGTTAGGPGRAAGRGAGPGEASGPGRRVVSPVAAWYVGAVLSQIPPPSGAAAGRVAYKTGTSYGNRDALALGYDGRFVAGVWMGRPDGTPVPGAFGGDLAAPLLFDLFDALGPRATPLPDPPPEALTLPTSRLPPTLRRFRAPGETAGPADIVAGNRSPSGTAEPLAILFPPDGAELEMAGAGLPARLRGGTPPYLWLLNGAPVARTVAGETASLPQPGSGYASLAVIDAQGRSQRVGFRVRPPGR